MKQRIFSDHTATTFNAPKLTRDLFDSLCRASGKTRTAVLVELMESYILSQAELLAERNAKFEQIDQSLSHRERPVDEWNYLPLVYRTDGLEDW